MLQTYALHFAGAVFEFGCVEHSKDTDVLALVEGTAEWVEFVFFFFFFLNLPSSMFQTEMLLMDPGGSKHLMTVLW